MLTITDKLELKSDNLRDCLILETRYLVQVNYTFDLSVFVSSFKGKAHFCVRKDQLKEVSFSLQNINSGPTKTITLEDNDSNSYLSFQPFKKGLIQVRGQVGGTHEEAYLNFQFEANLEGIQQFVDQVEQLLKFVDDNKAEEEYENLKQKE